MVSHGFRWFNRW